LAIVKHALLGKDASQLILSSFRYDTVESLSDALSTFLSSKLKNHSAIFESLASSKNWLETLGDFSSIEIESTKAKDNSLHLLWTNREDPEVVQFIEARIRLISLALNRINPLYYNATQSLALTYQKILDGVEEWELLYYFSDFLGELDKANAVSMEINRQLQLERP
jgi:REP element-mobilizing transposase RayT